MQVQAAVETAATVQHPNLTTRARVKQAGLSLIESLLVLAVIALVLIGAYQGYKAATGDVKSGDNIKAATQLAGATSRLYSQSGNFSGVSNTQLIGANLIPSGFRVDAATNTILNGWGGAVTVAPGNATGAATAVPAPANTTAFFKISFAGVEAGDCANFTSGISGTAAAVVVSPDGTAAPTTVKAVGGVLNPGAIATACANTGVKTITAAFN